GMAGVSGFSEWTWEMVQSRLLEAAETALMMPRDGGPSSKASFWPEYAGDYGGVRIRVRPSPGAVSRMEECWSWTNHWLGESERKTLSGWLKFRVSKDR